MKKVGSLILATGLMFGTFTESALAERTSLQIPPGAYKVYYSGKCNWLAPHLAAAGLPVQTFQLISARESGCSRSGVFVNNRTDLSTSRFGINFRTPTLRAGWRRWCGATHFTDLRNVSLDVKCTAAAYNKLGFKPWK